MKFPTERSNDIADYAEAYAGAVSAGWRSIDREALQRAATLLDAAYCNGRRVFACGNGGSAAISNHLVCDHTKGVATDTDLLPAVISLSANVEIITAVANDISYADIFAFQLSRLAKPQDILVAVSSSGNSPNVLAALAWARSSDVFTIGMTGFSGGRLRVEADISLHVAVHNYGVVEDVHQGLMHVLAQYIRQSHMHDATITARSF